MAYLVVLPLPAIQNAPSDRVATAMLQAIFPGYGPVIMAIFIMISTFGCVNSLVLAGARAYYAMAKDGLFFKQAGVLNQARVPGWSLVVQGIWSACWCCRAPTTPQPGSTAISTAICSTT